MTNLKITPPDWDYFSMKSKPRQELNKLAYEYAKESNQRLKELRAAGYGNNYATRTVTSYLKGNFESPEAADRGHASYAIKTGNRFISSMERIKALTDDQILDMLKQETFHLRRITGTVEGVESTYKSSILGMQMAMATAFHLSPDEVNDFVSTQKLTRVFESTAYRILNRMYGYDTALAKITNVKPGERIGEYSYKDFMNTRVVKNLEKRARMLAAENEGLPKDEQLGIESTEEYKAFIEKFVTETAKSKKKKKKKK